MTVSFLYGSYKVVLLIELLTRLYLHVALLGTK